MLDAIGNPMDLTSVTTLEARIREATLRQPSISVADGAIVVDTDNTVQFTLPAAIAAKAGIYIAEIGALDGAGDLMRTNQFYLFNEYSAWADDRRSGPPALDYIRLSTRDNDPVENELINNHDADLAEICAAAVRAVEFWNDTPPILSGYTYCTITFPFREIWLTGIQLFLFQMLEEHYRRNALQYSAGGVSTDDKNRHREYKAAWQERYQSYRNMIMHQKARLNMSAGFGSFLSGYPG